MMKVFMSACGLMYRPVFLCLFPAAAAMAQSGKNKGGITFGDILGLLILALIVIGVIVSNYMGLRRKSGDTPSNSPSGVSGRPRRLSGREKGIINEFSAYLPDTAEPRAIYESTEAYEHCVDKYVSKRLANNKKPGSVKKEDRRLSGLRQKLGHGAHSNSSGQLVFSTRNITVQQDVSIFTVDSGAMLIRNAKIIYMGEFYFTVHVAADFRDKARSLTGSDVMITFERNGEIYKAVVNAMGVDSLGRELRLSHSADLMRGRKRRYARLEMNCLLKYQITENAYGAKHKTSAVSARTMYTANISGGGLCFFDDTALAAGDTVLMTLMLQNDILSDVKAKVLMTFPIHVSGKTGLRYRHHLEYADMDNKKRERIINFVSEKLRKRDRIANILKR